MQDIHRDIHRPWKMMGLEFRRAAYIHQQSPALQMRSGLLQGNKPDALKHQQHHDNRDNR